MTAVMSCRRLLWQAKRRACSHAADNAGSRMPISTAMMPITTSSSTRVKAFRLYIRSPRLLGDQRAVLLNAKLPGLVGDDGVYVVDRALPIAPALDAGEGRAGGD